MINGNAINTFFPVSINKSHVKSGSGEKPLENFKRGGSGPRFSGLHNNKLRLWAHSSKSPQPQLLFFVETVEKNPSAVTGRVTLLRLPVGIVSEDHIVDVPVLPQAAPDGVFLKFLLHRHWLFPPFCVKTKR